MFKSIKNLANSIENANTLTESLSTMSKDIENNGLEITIVIKPLGDKKMPTFTEQANQSTSTDEISEKTINIDRDDEDLASQLILKNR